jgi:hypothetical protein
MLKMEENINRIVDSAPAGEKLRVASTVSIAGKLNDFSAA